MSRPRYLKMMDPAAAWELLVSRLGPHSSLLSEEEIESAAACGRVPTRPVRALVSSPAYHAAAMDGFAVRAGETVTASQARPLRLSLEEQARPIDTGDPLPEGFDAVIKVEEAHCPAERATVEMIEIVHPAAAWQHVRLCGEDIVQGEMIVPSGRVLSPFDVGALLAAGCVRIHVRRCPRVAIIATGSELIEPGETMTLGAVIEFNSRMLASLVREWGGEPLRLGKVADDREQLTAALAAALAQADVVVLNAGSSAGREDFTPDLLAAAGELLVHGINVMPGKPTAVAICDRKPVLGLPGYPVSAVVAAELLLRPLLAHLLGVRPRERERVSARLTRKLPSKLGHEEWVRVQVGRVGPELVAAPLGRGAGAVTTLSRAGGIVRIDALAEGLEAGSRVEVELLQPRAEVDATLIHVGSHDLALDVVADQLRNHVPCFGLSSANLGSLAGLLALGRGEAHFAGCHLLDPESGDYNLSYLRRYLPGRRITLVNLVTREQGFYVLPGNPKAITGVGDLARPGVRLVNRQRGAGTRILLDLRLADAGIDPAGMAGYEREAFTHMAVAVAVKSGVADTGLGIRAAACALGLDFVPLESERYDLAIPSELLEEPAIRALLAVISAPVFRAAALALGGYGVERTGEVIASL